MLAFDFGSGLTGFSDFLPWPSLSSEKPLFAQLKDAQKGIESFRLRIARQRALLDAQARSESRSLFYGLKFPPSHFLIEDILSFSEWEKIPLLGYKCAKLKLSLKAPEKQAQKLKRAISALPHLKWRLDLGGGSWPLWKRLLKFMGSRTDFIEDPAGAPLSGGDSRMFAEDWLPRRGFSIKIAKPARDSSASLERGLAASRWRRIIFTHSLEHPLGQAASAFCGAKFYQNHSSLFETCGFKCLSFYEGRFGLNERQDPVFRPPGGFGFGFGEALKKEPWKRWI